MYFTLDTLLLQIIKNKLGYTTAWTCRQSKLIWAGQIYIYKITIQLLWVEKDVISIKDLLNDHGDYGQRALVE